MKTFLGSCLFTLTICLATGARAQTADAPAAGDAGHWSISLERLFGIDHVSETESINGVDAGAFHATDFSVFGDPMSSVLTRFSSPRAGFDRFLAHHLSLGAGIGIYRGSESVASLGGLTTNESFQGIFVNPRIGYAARLTSWLAVWPRAGLTIEYSHADETDSDGRVEGAISSYQVAATVEVPLVFTLAPRVALTFGPTLDVSFAGDNRSGLPGTAAMIYETPVTEIGAQAGLEVVL
jgi:hypothetical protein